MDDIEGTLRLVFEVDTSDEEKILTDSQRKLLPKLMHQANECMLFIQEYTSQSYCESEVFAFFYCLYAWKWGRLPKLSSRTMMELFPIILRRCVV